MGREGSSCGNELAPDAAIARVARGQKGLVTTRQLLSVLSSRSQIHARVQAGRLHRRYRGVYAVGHTAPSAEQDYLAAALACGDGALVCDLAAADLWQLWPNSRRPVDVVVPGRGGRRARKGLRVHRRRLAPGDADRHRGVPVTSVERTLTDLRALVPRAGWLRAAHQAKVRYGVHVALPEPLTLSRLERRLVRICRRHGLPRPETNVVVAGLRGEHRVDAWWGEARLAVEVDGYAVHASQHAFENDRERTADLEDAGIRVLRIAEGQLADEARVAARIASRLGAEVRP